MSRTSRILPMLALPAVLVLSAVVSAQMYSPPDPRWQTPGAHVGAQAEVPKETAEPIPSPSGAKKDEKKSEDKKDAAAPLPEWQKMLAMVGVVAGGLMILFYLLRKLSPQHPKPLPREVFEILGKASIGFHQQVYLLRCGRKIFLIAVSSLGVERIGEIDSPVDVENLLRTCHGEKSPVTPEPPAETRPGKMSFDEIYRQINGEQVNRCFDCHPHPSTRPPAHLFTGSRMNSRLGTTIVFCLAAIFFAENLHAQRTGAVTPRIITTPAEPIPPAVPVKPQPEIMPPPTLPAAVPSVPTFTAEERFLQNLDEEARNLPSAESLETEEPEEESLAGDLWKTLSPGASQNVGTSIQLLVLLGVLSLAPAILLMVTCFVRIIVVLGILRQGLAAQGIPSTQVITALAVFMTFFIMYPVGKEIYETAVTPYQNSEITGEEAWNRGVSPLREFMYKQIVLTKNTDDIWLFWSYSPTPPEESKMELYTQEDVPLQVLVPAFMLSELKTAFLIGVQLLLPMLVIDLLVSTILVSMGMYMLPPTMISLPFKLLVFVMADGWRLVVEMLLRSFAA